MSAKAQLDGFIARYDPVIARRTKTVLAAMRKLCPGAHELVYDNYNALAIGFAVGTRVAMCGFPSPSIPAGSACSSLAPCR